MRELSLFTGGGGGVLGSKLLGWETIGYVEWDEYCQKTLRQRINDGAIDNAPIFCDIRSFISDGYASSYKGLVDVITAGFPCQPFSVGGDQLAEADPRNMWPATIECIRTIRPRYALLENVPGLLICDYIQRIFGDLAEVGYDARWGVLGTAHAGGDCLRERLWIVASPAGIGRAEVVHSAEGKRPTPLHRQAAGNGNPRSSRSKRISRLESLCDEPAISGSLDGVAHRVDRLKAAGNGQNPALVALAWQILKPE